MRTKTDKEPNTSHPYTDAHKFAVRKIAREREEETDIKTYQNCLFIVGFLDSSFSMIRADAADWISWCFSM